MNRIGRSLYKAIQRIIPTDITNVLLLRPLEFRAPDVSQQYSCKLASLSDLEHLCWSNQFSISQALIDSVCTSAITVVLAMHNNRTIGICFFKKGNVSAKHNRGGEAFKGIGLQLPPETFYLFKVEVNPTYRGQRLFATLLAFALNHFKSEYQQPCALVTTTDWTNTAFLNGSRRLGFVSVGHAIECRLGRKHWFHLPPPFAIHDHENIAEHTKIRLVKP